MSEKKLSEIFTLIEEILSFSTKGNLCLKNKDYTSLITLLKIRENKINQLIKVKKDINSWAKSHLTTEDIEKINENIKFKIENVSKVDRKIFDIIRCEQNKLGEKIHQATQGLSFLRKYKKQINSDKIFIKTI
jgi:hypothetical protein